MNFWRKLFKTSPPVATQGKSAAPSSSKETDGKGEGYVARMKVRGSYMYFDLGKQQLVSHPRELSSCFKDEGTAAALLAKVLSRSQADGVATEGKVMTLEQAIREHVELASKGAAASVDYVVRLKFGSLYT